MARTGEWFGAAWKVVSSDLIPFVVLALIYVAIMAVAGWVFHPLPVLLGGPLTAAIYAAVLAKLRTGRLDLDQTQSIGAVFLPALIAWILVSVFVSIGMVFVIIPGLIIGALYLFPLILIVDKRMAFWDAMEASRIKVQSDLMGFFLFVLASIGINLLGALCLGVGLLVSMPVTWCAVAIAYRELWAEQPATESGPSPA